MTMKKRRLLLQITSTSWMTKLWRYKDPDSNNEQGKKKKLINISNFLRNFEREISGSSADTNNLRIHRSNYDSSEEDNDYWPPNKRIRTEPSSDEEQE